MHPVYLRDACPGTPDSMNKNPCLTILNRMIHRARVLPCETQLKKLNLIYSQQNPYLTYNLNRGSKPATYRQTSLAENQRTATMEYLS